MSSEDEDDLCSSEEGEHSVKNIMLCSLAHRVKTEHLVARTFFSVSRTFSQFITRTCVWLKSGMCCTFAHRKSHPLTIRFIDNSLMCLTHFRPFLFHTTSDNTDFTVYD